MTSRRALPFGSGDDANRDAVAPLLSQMRAELLVLPREEVIEEHIEMMAFEQKLLATPRFVRPRVPMPASRRAAFVVACVSATIASCGLSAAGALPEPLQHITDSIARTLGVPEPSHPTPAANHDTRGAVGAPKPASVRPAPQVETTKPKPLPKAVTKKKASHPKVTHTLTSSGQQLPTTPKPIAIPRPEKPSTRVHPKGGPKSPPKYSDNTPPGYPIDWRARAMAAAAAQIKTCAQANTLSQNACPQSAPADTAAQSIHWTLINDPAAEAVAIAHTRTAPGSTAPITTVTVYERFQMDVSYTVDGATSPHIVYSAGIAKASMTWNGSAFQHVDITTGSVAGHLVPGLIVPLFERPAVVGDDSVLIAVQTAFTNCATAAAPAAAGSPIGGCSAIPTGATLNGDPTQGATVVFDAESGEFTVTGTYSYTSDQGAVTVPYTATLFFDGSQLQVLDITGS